MLPGPDVTVACPACGAFANVPTLRSGNTFGTRVWTDGKHLSPMLPEIPPVVECGSCHAVYFLAAARRVNDREAPAVCEPTEHRYYDAIASGLALNHKEEFLLRLYAWWKSNDRVRFGLREAEADNGTIGTIRRDNMTALIGLLGPDDQADQVMRAELLRQLGRFDETFIVINGVTEAELAPAVQTITASCEARDSYVQEIRAIPKRTILL
jgi:hypothetical protein